jgi:hypothetical protein
MRFSGGKSLEHDSLKDRRSAIIIRQFRSAKARDGVSRKGAYINISSTAENQTLVPESTLPQLSNIHCRHSIIYDGSVHSHPNAPYLGSGNLFPACKVKSSQSLLGSEAPPLALLAEPLPFAELSSAPYAIQPRRKAAA